jgi:hypothetical protein
VAEEGSFTAAADRERVAQPSISAQIGLLERELGLPLFHRHRYFFYFGAIFNVILTYDAIDAFRNNKDQFGHVTLGTLVLLTNAILLWAYTLGCHSCRHIMGGRLNNFSKHPLRYKAWGFVSRLNGNHMKLAWVSLFGVALTDVYVLCVSSGTFHNPVFF